MFSGLFLYYTFGCGFIMIKAVFFDLDGTLVNSLYDLAQSNNYVLKKHNFEEKQLDEYNYFVGNGIPKLIERTLPEEARNDKTVNLLKEEFLNYYRLHCTDKTYVYDGIFDLITALKGKGIIIAVVTNKAQEMAQIIVKHFFGDSFDLIIGKSENTKLKPDPSAVNAAMQSFKVNPRECIFIGDSNVDVKTAQNCGAVSVGVTWGFRTKKELCDAGVEYVIEKPNELLKITEGK